MLVHFYARMTGHMHVTKILWMRWESFVVYSLENQGDKIRQASTSRGGPVPPRHKIKHLAAYYRLLSAKLTTQFLNRRFKT